MSEEVRWRGKSAAKGTGSESSPTSPSQPPPHKLRVEWDLLLWMFASFAVLYFSDFASHLLFNPVVRRWWLLTSVTAFITCISCLVYSMRKDTTLNASNWQEKAPVSVPIATVSALTGTISLCIALWPVWRLYTLLIIPVLSMGFVSTVSLFNL